MNYNDLLFSYYDKILEYAKKLGHTKKDIKPFVKVYADGSGVFGYEILSKPFEWNSDYLISHFSTISEFEHKLEKFLD